ncbi:DUF2125 domain-containing protein [Sulfitobacter sp. HNIBRBA3233]|uniref:DUF2125 domain-containing protein n=1 Tax=Sulfitobacter marinivivus TaxID=3158558 RepID=UPI0032DEA8DC
MTRRLIWLGAVVLLVWSGWWWVATSALQRGIVGGVQTLRNAGWMAETGPTAPAGFPLHIGAAIDAPSLSPPGSPVVLTAPRADLGAAIYWPGNIAITAPEATAAWDTALGQTEMRSDLVQLALSLGPSRALPLEDLTLSATALTAVTAPIGALFSADRLDARLSALSAQDAPNTYGFDLDITGLRPDPSLRDDLRLPDSLPEVFDTTAMRGTLSFDGPLDRTGRGRVQPVALALDDMRIVWGAVSLTARTSLEIDPQGRASGPVQVSVTRWRELLDLLQNAGTLPADRRQQIETVLSAAAGGTDRLDLNLTVNRGVLTLGFIPLGRVAPIRLPYRQ